MHYLLAQVGEQVATLPTWAVVTIAALGAPGSIALLKAFEAWQKRRDKREDRLERREQSEVSRLWEQIGELKAEIKSLKNEIRLKSEIGHHYRSHAFRLLMRTITLRSEVNDELERQQKPAKYTLTDEIIDREVAELEWKQEAAPAEG